MDIERRIQRRVGKALRRHSMLEEGDRVLVAVSGGKDSTALARLLAERRGRLPIRYELVACHVVTDLAPADAQADARLDTCFADLGVLLVRRAVSVLARLEPDKGPLNCFFCAMQRRKAILAAAKELGCRKIAYGHNREDVVETLLLNMLYHSEISTMPARLELDTHDAVIVRPLWFVAEADLAWYAARHGLDACAPPPCPYGQRSRRARVKRLMAELAAEDDRVWDNTAAALGRVKTGYLEAKLRGVV